MKLQHSYARQHPRPLALSVIFGLALFLGTSQARATNFSGNGSTGFGGAVGGGTLVLTDDGTTISGTLNLGGGKTDLGGNALVIYIDTGAGGGFADTSGFNDQSHANQITVSGVKTGSGRSVMTFASGFAPQYAVSLIPGNFGGLYQLANGTNNSMPYKGSVNLSASAPYTFSFPAASLGLIPGSKATIKIFGTEISTTGYRSSEAIAGNDTGSLGQGWFPFTQTASAAYTFDAGAPVLTPVTFQVDMSAQIAVGAFNPGAGDSVYAAGTFQSVPWSGFQLTNGTGTNSAIYAGTYLDADPTNSAEQYKFYEVTSGGGTTNWEGTDNRPFTVQAGGQTLALVYFDDIFPTPSATTNNITFQVDMTDQILLGAFNPATETIQALGTFENPKWTAGFILTNNPNAANTNIYSGVAPDGNYPGTYEQFKYVIVSTGNTYESTPNRVFNTPAGNATFPLAYFNNVSNVVTVPITFQVDMTSQAGNLNAGAGIVPGVSGSFQSPTYSGAPLTNTPINGNTNIYSGTFLVTEQPGYVYQYKFVIINNGTLTYESPASTGTQNRVFAMPSTAETLPLVYWSDTDPANTLPLGTLVTFTVDMNSAVDVNGVPFDPSADAVLINGTFPPTGGFISALWTDGFPSFDYPANVMNEINLSSTLYTNNIFIPAGSPLEVTYKYAIYHGVGNVNTNCDNEAGFAQNHVRYIRGTGTYTMPTDIFGQQATNAAAAAEISFGNLIASHGSPGTVLINWLGRPGVYLQVNTNLSTSNWTTVDGSGGLMSTNLPANGNSAFYRLVNP
jgi:hypothetical protein